MDRIESKIGELEHALRKNDEVMKDVNQHLDKTVQSTNVVSDNQHKPMPKPRDGVTSERQTERYVFFEKTSKESFTLQK